MTNQTTLPCNDCVYKEYCNSNCTDCSQLLQAYKKAESNLDEAISQNASRWTIMCLQAKYTSAKKEYNDYFFKAFEETGEVPF